MSDLAVYARTCTYAGLPGGYTASIVYQGRPFYGPDGKSGDLLRWMVTVENPQGNEGHSALFSKIEQAEQWLGWQIDDLKVRYPADDRAIQRRPRRRRLGKGYS